MKKTLSLFLSLMMLISTVSIFGITANANTPINEIRLYRYGANITYEALDGMNPAYNFGHTTGVQIDTDYLTNGIEWLDVTNPERPLQMDSESTFTHGRRYSVRVALKNSNGYEFNTAEGHPAVSAYFNINNDLIQCTVSEIDGVFPFGIFVTTEFTCPDLYEITSAAVSASAPKIGSTPGTHASVSSTANYVVDTEPQEGFLENNVRYTCLSDGTYLTEDDVFEQGKTYRMEVRIKAKTGSYFSNYENAIRVTVPAGYYTTYTHETEYIVKDLSQYITVYKDFFMVDRIDEINVTVPVDFKAGGRPYYGVELEEPEKYVYYVYENSDIGMNSVRYYDITAKRCIRYDETFISGHRYRIYIAIQACDGYEMRGRESGLPEATINGVSANKSRNGQVGADIDIPSNVCLIWIELGTCKIDIADCNIALPARSVTYTGKPRYFALKVTNGSKTLKEGTDYEILYMGEHTNAGMVSMEVCGLGNYQGSVKKVAKIYSKEITPRITLSRNEFVYNGKEQKPTIKVYDGNTLLKKDKDYTLTLKPGKDVYIYKAKIKLKGNYKGSKTVTYTIKPKATTLNKITKYGKKDMTVSWKKQATQTSGYEIQYSTTAGFKSGTVKTVKINSKTTTSKKITGLKKNKKYYVRIRTFTKRTIDNQTKTIYSNWSATQTVKTKK